jgi:periplasmic divalent cation tolerance protein
MTDDSFVFIYSTFPDEQSAKSLARVLVEQKLAACVNLYPAITSIYEWEGAIEMAAEVAVFIKTRRALADRVIALSHPLHPYTVPCFLVLPVVGGNEDYLAWLREQTRHESLAEK